MKKNPQFLHYDYGETFEQIVCEDQKLIGADKRVQMLLVLGARENEFIIPFVADFFSTV